MAPPSAAAAFGAGLPLAERYAELLATEGVQRGLIGPREAPRLWERHLLNSLAPARFLVAGADVLDLGSGAGLPGIPLAIARPDLQVTLLEPMLRRATFLQEALVACQLTEHVRVVRARAEEVGGGAAPLRSAAVVCRAVAPMNRLLPWARPLLRRGGQVLAIKGASAERELATSRTALVEAGWTLCLETVDDLGEPTWVLRARLGSPPSARSRSGKGVHA